MEFLPSNDTEKGAFDEDEVVSEDAIHGGSIVDLDRGLVRSVQVGGGFPVVGKS